MSKSYHPNEVSNPEWDPEGTEPFDHQKIYINKTGGLWYRVNYEKGSTELWFNGQWQAEWPTTEIETIIQPLLRHALDIGKRERSKEIKALLNV